MAKPTRYTKQDRRRKRLHAPFNLSVGALIRHQSKLRALHIEKAILATQALRRCVDLETWVTDTMQGLESISYHSGCCMCGDAMEGHASAITCGHSPVDSGEYYLSELSKEAAKLLAKPMVDAPKDKPYSYPQMQQQINHGLWQLKQKDKTIEELSRQLEAVKKELFLQTARGEPHDGC